MSPFDDYPETVFEPEGRFHCLRLHATLTGRDCLLRRSCYAGFGACHNCPVGTIHRERFGHRVNGIIHAWRNRMEAEGDLHPSVRTDTLKHRPESFLRPLLPREVPHVQ